MDDQKTDQNTQTHPAQDVQGTPVAAAAVPAPEQSAAAPQATGNASLNGKATAGLVLGCIGLIAWFVPLFGAPITILGLVFGIKGLKSDKRGMAVAAIVLSSIGLLLTIINASIGAYMGATGQHPVVNELRQ